MGCCVQKSGLQENWVYDAWAVNTNLTLFVWDVIELQTGRMLACEGNQVWRTDDGGATPWLAAAAPPAAANIFDMIELPNGDVYCAASNGFYLSVDGGVNWAFVGAAITTGNFHAFAYQESTGYFYAADLAAVYRSVDNCVTWQVVYDGNYNQSVLVASDGAIYISDRAAVGGTKLILRSTDNGATWSVVYTDSMGGLIVGFYEPGDGYLYAADTTGHFYRSADGIDWAYICLLNYSGGGDPVFDMILASDGLLYAVTDNAVTYQGVPGFLDRKVIEHRPASNASTAIVEWSGNSRLYVADDPRWIYWWGPSTDVGRDATCLDEVFVANKGNIAQLTDVWVNVNAASTWLNRFPAPSFPFLLLPAPMANNDAVYFGIDTSVVDSGPFCSLVFDLYHTVSVTTWDLDWEYYDGVGWVALNVQDGTLGLTAPGVNSVHWVPPDDWTVANLFTLFGGAAPNVTARWVRARVNNIVGFLRAPTQGNRDIYTVNWPSVLIDGDEIGGDLPALLRVRLHNRSDEDGYDTQDELCLLSNRVMAGLRGVDRGENFAAYINLAEDGVVANTYAQNPIGITVTDGTGTVTAAEIRAAVGIAQTHTTQGNGIDVYDDASLVTFGPSVTRDFYGTFHAFLRAQLYEPSSSPAGDHDDVRVRLRVQSGSGGLTFTTTHAQFTGRDAWDGATGIEEDYKDFQLLNLGRVDIPVTGSMHSDDLPDQLTITVQVASAAATNLRVDLYDLVLVPVDEWSLDAVDRALEDDSGVDNGFAADVDSLHHRKERIRALVRTADAAELIKAEYRPGSPKEAFLQNGLDQRLWFLTARGVYMGTHTGANNVATLEDDHADFLAAGVLAGQPIFNVTDGAVGSVGATVTETTISDCGLTGGAENDWDTGDVYLIVCPNWRSEPWVAHSVQLWAAARYLGMRGGE